jgi:hypothetical protein
MACSHQSAGCDVRPGSKAAAQSHGGRDRFTPNNGHEVARPASPLRATSRHFIGRLISKRQPAIPKDQQASGETIMERDAEIDQIKRELAILRDRYAIYGRSARMLRFFFLYLIPIVALVLAIMLSLFDPLYGLFWALMMLVLAALVALSLKSTNISNIRWIDVASQSFGNMYIRKMYEPYFFYPDARPRPRSDAELLEWQIADRERRLSELGESALGLKTD